MPNAPQSSPRSRVSRAAASRAVDSLLKWIRAQQNPHNLAATRHDDFIHLILSLTKTPHKLHCKPYRIPLPHPLHDSSTVYLILDERPNSPLTVSSARDLVCSLSLPINQILTLSDLRSGILLTGELLFADRRIARRLCSFEKGKNKKRKRSMLVEVDFTRKVWPEYVRQVCFSTVLNLGPGTCSGIRVGRASQESDEIVDNLMATVDGVVRNVPRKWSNVMGFHLKTSESLALPIYEKSNWSHKKVGDDDDDGNEVSEEEEGMEDEKHRKVERRAEIVTWKRARDGGEVGNVKKKILRYGVGRFLDGSAARRC
ncbi:ribosomal L1 domain-containing protein 1-like isoform X2 [Phalaenopsis equestris]|uniref:ribosomal L1 domain-containing protein 1-like isoform X2 n=1 Tax=Phalaenopsis equestris TaxID=78828 RepID=UPI0009E2D740|nr:ribosomal L1 domain-containing protein 1-like isoform X2 [Phalaenopsis equestris]